MAPPLDWTALGLALLAFFLAVGLAAHALDELQGRPLGTGIGDAPCVASPPSRCRACALGVYGVFLPRPATNWPLAFAVPVGAVLVVGYNLELFDGRLHNDHAFAWGWGGFPVAVGYVAQSPGLAWPSLAAAVAATLGGVGTSTPNAT